MRRTSVLRNNRGLTLIEVLVSLVIVFIVFLGISGSGLFVLNQNIRNSLRDEAVSVAEMDLEQVRNMSFSDIVDNTYHVYRQIRGLNVDYTVSRTVGGIDLNNRQVTVDVAWTRRESNLTKTYTHRGITIVRQR